MATTPNTYTLGKQQRLKSRKSIDAIFKNGHKVNASPFKAFYTLQVAEQANKPGLKLGVGVSKRFFKHAVDRNRVKRQIREAWRLQNNTLQQLVTQQNQSMQVFVIFTGNELPITPLVQEKVAILLNKLLHEAGKNHTKTT